MRAIRKYFQRYWKYKIQQTKEELNTMKIGNDIYYVGVNDHQVDLFEGQYVVPNGMSYNSYVIKDEKIAVMDTVDANFTEEWMGKVAEVLDGAKPDYLVVQHMEPDHAANIENFMKAYPDTTVVANTKTFTMMENFFRGMDLEGKKHIVANGDTLTLGKHVLTFVFAPMVHWPEVMVTYEKTEKILFSADAFGSFGAVDGNIFADEIDDKVAWLSEARRYYTNIVGKFGMSVQGLLKKAAGLEIRMICPLHSVIWREDLPWLIDKYLKWSSYTPEEKSVTIAYGSVYGHTEKAADILAGKLADRGIRHISVFDVSKTHPSYIIADAFRTSAIVFASITYNGGIFCNMDTLLHQLAAHGLTNRTAALIQNGTWAATTSKQMGEILGTMKNIHVLESDVTIKSALKDNQEAELDALADAIAASLQ